MPVNQSSDLENGMAPDGNQGFQNDIALYHTSNECDKGWLYDSGKCFKLINLNLNFTWYTELKTNVNLILKRKYFETGIMSIFLPEFYYFKRNYETILGYIEKVAANLFTEVMTVSSGIKISIANSFEVTKQLKALLTSYKSNKSMLLQGKNKCYFTQKISNASKTELLKWNWRWVQLTSVEQMCYPVDEQYFPCCRSIYADRNDIMNYMKAVLEQLIDVSYVLVETMPHFCPQNHFQCGDMACIHSHFVCDTFKDCISGEDEENCSCGKDAFECKYDKKCIPAAKYCDFRVDCIDHSDEIHCTYPSCSAQEFECKNHQCIPVEKRCDFVENCFDKSDEYECTQLQTTFVDTFQCMSGDILPIQKVGDGRQDCFFGEDEHQAMLLRNITCPEGYVRCSNESKVCLEFRFLCLYDYDEFGHLKHCHSGQHLRSCVDVPCPSKYYKCLFSYCVPIRNLCDGMSDCPLSDDERNCRRHTLPGHFRCRFVSFVLPYSEVCDGVLNCPQGEDEEMCNFTCPENCSCFAYNLICDGKNISNWENLNTDMKDNQVRSLSFRNCGTNESHLANTDFTQYMVLYSMDVSVNLVNFLYPGIFNALVNLVHLNLSFNNIKIIEPLTFQSLHLLTSVDLKGNPITTIGPYGFYGLVQLPSLDLSDLRIITLFNMSFTGLKSVILLNLSHNSIDGLPAGVFGNMTNLRSLDISQNQIVFPPVAITVLPEHAHLSTDFFRFCCLAQPIDSCLPGPHEFSSCNELIANGYLVLFVLVIASASCVISVFNIFYVWCLQPEEGPYSEYNILFLNSLVSCSLMSIYLLVIIFAHYYFQGEYMRYELDWISNPLCKMAGYVALLSEVSTPLRISALTWSASHFKII